MRNAMLLRTFIARLDQPEGTLTNRKQLMLGSLRLAASFAEINSASEAAFASELLAHLVDDLAGSYEIHNHPNYLPRDCVACRLVCVLRGI
jgi:hypothetical protein